MIKLDTLINLIIKIDKVELGYKPEKKPFPIIIWNACKGIVLLFKLFRYFLGIEIFQEEFSKSSTRDKLIVICHDVTVSENKHVPIYRSFSSPKILQNLLMIKKTNNIFTKL